MKFNIKRFSITLCAFVAAYLLMQISPALIRDNSFIEEISGYKFPTAAVPIAVALAVAGKSKKGKQSDFPKPKAENFA